MPAGIRASSVRAHAIRRLMWLSISMDRSSDVLYRKIVLSALQTARHKSAAQNCPSVVVFPCTGVSGCAIRGHGHDRACCRLQIQTWLPGVKEASLLMSPLSVS